MIDADDAIVTEALRWLGVPYAHLQHTRWGCDCVGLLIGVAKACGRLALDYVPAPYPRDWHLHNTRELLAEGIVALGGTLVEKRASAPGMIALFRPAGYVASHAGILVPGVRLVHASQSAGQVESRRCDLQRHQTFVSVYRFPTRKDSL